MRSSLVFLGSVLAVVFSSTVSAQCKDSVVGTWNGNLHQTQPQLKRATWIKPFSAKTLQGFSPTRRMAE
jgi:hypothetical protein